MRLTDRQHWDALYQRGPQPSSDATSASPAASTDDKPARKVSGIKAFLRAALGSRIDRFRPYDHFVLWNRIYPRHLDQLRGKRAVEIGSAPGNYLVRLRDEVGCEPFGIEYSPDGAERNREAFRRAGIKESNVVEGDLFEVATSPQYRESFDAVISRGFLEHFTDPRLALAAHVALLKAGGLLAVSVPNLRGVNWLLTKVVNEPLLAIHNLDLMTPEALSAAVAAEGIEVLFCDYYGVFNFDLTYAPPGSPWQPVMRGLSYCQALANFGFRAVFDGRGGDLAATSPHILCIGRKPKSADAT